MKKYLILLFACFIFGFILRTLFLYDNLLFGFEQGRDFEIANQIASLKKFTLLGPKTDIEGIYHGVYYYYFLAILSFVSHGNPYVVALFFSAINLISIFSIFLISKEFVPKKFALFSAFIYSISFNMIIYARWLSNASFSVVIFSFFLLFFVKSCKRFDLKNVSLLGAFWGLTLHFEILNFLHSTFLVMLFFLINRQHFRRIPPIKLMTPLIFFLISLLPFILFNMKHDNLLIHGLIKYFSNNDQNHFQLTKNFVNYSQGFFREISNTLFPFFPFFSYIFILLIFICFAHTFFFKKREKQNLLILIFFLTSSLPLVVFTKYQTLEQFFAGAGIPIIIMISYLLYWVKTLGLITPAIIISSIAITFHLFYDVIHLKNRENIFYHMPYKEITYGRQRQIFAYIHSHHTSYSIDAFTTPIYRPEGWHYLNSFFKKNIPEKKQNEKNKLLFLVVEPFTSLHWKRVWLEKYDEISFVVAKKQIGGFLIQTRKNLN